MPNTRVSAARIAPLAIPIAILAASVTTHANAQDKSATAKAAPYVFHFKALDEAAAERAEGVFLKHPSVARIESNTRLATLEVWMKRQEGAARPQLLNTAQSARRFATLDLELDRVEAPKWSKAKVYIVEATGGGWSGTSLAREAIESLVGVRQIFMSGTRATFTLDKGLYLDTKAVAEALSSRSLELVGYRMEYRPLPAVAWSVAASGLGWATAAGKARAALLSMPNVQDVFVADDILVHMQAGGVLELEDVRKRLEKLEVEVSKIIQDEKRLLR